MFAREQEDAPTDEERDFNNEALWRKLAATFAETQLMLREKAQELGIDLDAVDDEAIRKETVSYTHLTLPTKRIV